MFEAMLLVWLTRALALIVLIGLLLLYLEAMQK